MCVPVKGLNLFYFLGTIVSGLGTHNSNTSGRTNPRPAGLVINGSARAETKVQTANRVWQRIAKDEVECNLLQTQRPKKNRHA